MTLGASQRVGCNCQYNTKFLLFSPIPKQNPDPKKSKDARFGKSDLGVNEKKAINLAVFLTSKSNEQSLNQVNQSLQHVYNKD